jgi:hypothetical protein
MADRGPRTVDEVLDVLPGMQRYCRRLRLAPILLTDPRGVVAGDEDGQLLATALHDHWGEHRASGLIMGWNTKPHRKIRWKISLGYGTSVWIRGQAFAGHPYRGKIPTREGLARWLPDGVIIDPCVGDGSVIIGAQRAGRNVLGVTDRPAAVVVAGLGQGMLFDPLVGGGTGEPRGILNRP